MSSARISGKFTIYDTDPLVSQHRVQDIHILPGVAQLDLVFKVFRAARIDTSSIVLRDILFHEPIVTNADLDRKVTVTVEDSGADGRITVTSVPWKGDRALGDERATHMTCALRRAAPSLEGAARALDLSAARLDQTIDLDACYSVTRHIGIFHDDFMKCHGTVSPLPSGDFVGDVALGDKAYERSADFVLHPVFLDCSTIVPLFHLRDRLDEASLFIPFAIEEFRGGPLTGRREVRIVVERPDGEIDKREILHHSFSICDLDGREIVRFRKFGVKRVRSLEGIRRLLARANGVHPVPVPPQPAERQAAVNGRGEAGGDPIIDLIGSLIARHGNVTWKSGDAKRSFFDLELDSLMLLDISQSLEQRLGVRLYPTLLFERPTAADLAEYLRESFPEACAKHAQNGAESGGERRAEPPARSRSSARDKAPVRGKAPGTPEILVPRWLPAAPGEAQTKASRVALFGVGEDAGLATRLAAALGDRVHHKAPWAGGEEAVAAFVAALGRGEACDEIWLVGAGHDFTFHLVKALLSAGRLSQPLALKAITINAFRVHGEAPDPAAGHGVWGLLQSLSREYPSVRVSTIDIDRAEIARAGGTATEAWVRLIDQCGARPRELWAIRAERLYERRLLAARAAATEAAPIKQGGAYMVIGGASGVGLELVRYLRRSLGARVAVVGRSRLSDELRRTLSAEGAYGEDILYVSAAVDDEAALSAAVQETRGRFGHLNGVVHSAMVLDDRRLADMDAQAFAKPLGPKVTGAEVLARVTEGLDLDFILFFSSIQSFVGNVSQANYATASTFLDGFAASMRANRPYPVVVINWGFFSEVGAVATDLYRALMARQGVHGLRVEEAMTALQQVLASGWEQAAIVAAEESVLEEMGLSRSIVLGRSAARGAVAVAPLVADPEKIAAYLPTFGEVTRAMDLLLAATRRRIVQILRDLGLLNGAELKHSVESAVRAGAISGEHARLVRTMLRHLEESHALDAAGLSDHEFSEAIARLAERHPSLRSLAPLLQSCVRHYPQILAGKMPAMEAVFPGGSVDLVRPVYGESEISRFYNEIVAKAVHGLAAAAPHRPVRILEVGAGTGGTTIEVMKVLEASGTACEYWYTELWDKLLNEAQGRLAARYPALRFRFLDIGTDPAVQGLREEFDIIVATNVIHATRDLHVSIRHIKKLLKPSGALVLNESVEVQEYSTYTFGLLPGWWNAVDPRERLAGSPLASSSTWTAILQDEGFTAVEQARIAGKEASSALTAQQVFVAISDGEVRLAPERRGSEPRVAPARENELPSALAGKLRRLDLAALTGGKAPAARRLATFQDHRDNIWVFLNNPPANTYTDELVRELSGTLQALAEPARGRFVYLSHFGEYYSLGGDRSEIIRKLSAGEHDAIATFARNASALIHAITSLDALVVAVVNGAAQGGGMETLLATDLQVVRDGVKMGLPEIKSGLIPGMGGLTYLKDLIGMPRAKRLVMLGELISAEEALELGIISHVVEDPFEAALELAEDIKHVSTALHMKRVLNREVAMRLAADIEDWIAYATQHTELIDARRISDSQMMLTGRATAEEV